MQRLQNTDGNEEQPQQRVVFNAPKVLTEKVDNDRAPAGRDKRAQYLRYIFAAIAIQNLEGEEKLQELFLSGCRQMGIDPIDLF